MLLIQWDDHKGKPYVSSVEIWGLGTPYFPVKMKKSP